MLNCCGCFNYCICKYIYKKVIIKFCNFSYCNFIILNCFSFGRQPGCPRRPKFSSPSDSPIDGPCVGSVTRCSPRPPAMKPSAALRFSALALSLSLSLPRYRLAARLRRRRGTALAVACPPRGGGLPPPPSPPPPPPPPPPRHFLLATPRGGSRGLGFRPSIAGRRHGRAASQRRPLRRRSSPPSPPSACRSSPPATTSSPTTATATPSTTSSRTDSVSSLLSLPLPVRRSPRSALFRADLRRRGLESGLASLRSRGARLHPPPGGGGVSGSVVSRWCGVRFDGCFEANLSGASCCLTLINRSCCLDSTLS